MGFWPGQMSLKLNLIFFNNKLCNFVVIEAGQMSLGQMSPQSVSPRHMSQTPF